MYKILFKLAAIGMIVSLIVHGLTLLAVDVLAQVPAVSVLHTGIFVAWIPAILQGL